MLLRMPRGSNSTTSPPSRTNTPQPRAGGSPVRWLWAEFRGAGGSSLPAQLESSGACAKGTRRCLSDLASGTLPGCGCGAATRPGHCQRGLKAAPNCFPEGVYFLPAGRQGWLYKQPMEHSAKQAKLQQQLVWLGWQTPRERIPGAGNCLSWAEEQGVHSLPRATYPTVTAARLGS